MGSTAFSSPPASPAELINRGTGVQWTSTQPSPDALSAGLSRWKETTPPSWLQEPPFSVWASPGTWYTHPVSHLCNYALSSQTLYSTTKVPSFGWLSDLLQEQTSSFCLTSLNSLILTPNPRRTFFKERKCHLRGKAPYVYWREIKNTECSDQNSASRQTYVPLGIIMRFQGAFVSSWEHNQTAIFPVNVLHGRPGTNNVIAGPEGEIVQILVQGVTGCLLAWNRSQC